MIRKTKFLFRLAKKNINLQRNPFKLNFYLTNRCNSKCSTCNIWKKKVENELNLDEINKFFEKNNYFSWIDLTGGEICLRDDLKTILKIIFDHCQDLYLLHFPTNGIMTEKIIDLVVFIKKNFKGKLVVSVSLDGPPEIHNKIRGLECWNKAVSSYQRLNEIIPKNVFFGYTMSKDNLGLLRPTIKRIKEIIPYFSVNNLHLNLAQVSDLYYANVNNISPSIRTTEFKKELVQEIEYLLKNRKIKLDSFYFLESYFLKKLKNYIETNKYPHKRCSALSSTISIDPQGIVYPCLFFNNKLGTLRGNNFDLKPLIYSQNSKRLKKNILNHCPHCWTACEAYPSILSSMLLS